MPQNSGQEWTLYWTDTNYTVPLVWPESMIKQLASLCYNSKMSFVTCDISIKIAPVESTYVDFDLWPPVVKPPYCVQTDKDRRDLWNLSISLSLASPLLSRLEFCTSVCVLVCISFFPSDFMERNSSDIIFAHLFWARTLEKDCDLVVHTRELSKNFSYAQCPLVLVFLWTLESHFLEFCPNS